MIVKLCSYCQSKHNRDRRWNDSQIKPLNVSIRLCRALLRSCGADVVLGARFRWRWTAVPALGKLDSFWTCSNEFAIHLTCTVPKYIWATKIAGESLDSKSHGPSILIRGKQVENSSLEDENCGERWAGDAAVPKAFGTMVGDSVKIILVSN